MTGREIPVREEAAPAAGDPPELVAANARAREELGWAPRARRWRTMIADAWAWHQAHPDGYGGLSEQRLERGDRSRPAPRRGRGAASITAKRSGSAAASAS